MIGIVDGLISDIRDPSSVQSIQALGPDKIWRKPYSRLKQDQMDDSVYEFIREIKKSCHDSISEKMKVVLVGSDFDVRPNFVVHEELAASAEVLVR
jgi:hypothetical protein